MAGGGKTCLLLPQAKFRPGAPLDGQGLSEITSDILIVKHLIEEAINGHLSVYC